MVILTNAGVPCTAFGSYRANVGLERLFCVCGLNHSSVLLAVSLSQTLPTPILTYVFKEVHHMSALG